MIRVNAGGTAYTDSAGNLWSADTGYNSGVVYSTGGSITGTPDPALYSVGRFDNSPAAPSLQYSFTVPNGWYQVRLHFAEPVLGPGGRRFNMLAEGTQVFTELDIASEAGVLVALIKTVNVRVSDGQLDLQFLHGSVDNPFIVAIDIRDSDSPTTPTGISTAAKSGTQINLSWTASTDDVTVTGYGIERCQGATCTNFTQIAMTTAAGYEDSGLSPLTKYRYRIRAVDSDGNTSGYSDFVSTMTSMNGPFTTVRVNAGGGAYTDTSGHVWGADTGYNSGTVFSTGAAIAGTSDPDLYRVGRFDGSSAPPTLQYSFSAPNGGYEVHLLFAEPGLGPGGRKFNVVIEGASAFANLDVASEAGTLAALTKTATTAVADGQLNIQLLHGAADNPMISAIEIVQTSVLDTQAPAVPGSFVASAVSGTRVNLGWGTSTDNVGVTGYRVERCEGASCTSFAEIATNSGTTFSDMSAAPATTYRYRVRATDTASNFSGYSAIRSVTTYSNVDPQAPSAPTNVSATAVSSTDVSLSWTASTDDTGVVGYRVERCQGLACSTFSQIATPAGTTYSDGGLAVSTAYRYRVRAVDSVPNVSAYSPVTGVTTLSGGDALPPGPPASLTATTYSPVQIDLNWAASTDNVGVAGYFIERCAGSGCSNFSQVAALPPVTVYSDTGLAGSATYRYRVRAWDADGNLSPYSPIATTATASGSGTAGSAAYQYDSFGRLKQVTVVPQ